MWSLFWNIPQIGQAFKYNGRYFNTTKPLKLIYHDVQNRSFRFNIKYGVSAVILYRHREDVMNVIDLHHTYVPTKHRGKGIASIMAEEVFEFLMAHNVQVSLSCPFLVDFYEQHPEFKRILYTPEKPKKHGR